MVDPISSDPLVGSMGLHLNIAVAAVDHNVEKLGERIGRICGCARKAPRQRYSVWPRGQVQSTIRTS